MALPTSGPGKSCTSTRSGAPWAGTPGPCWRVGRPPPFFRVDRDHRLAGAQVVADLAGKVHELGVAIRVLGAFKLRGGALPRPAHRGLPLDTRVHLSDGLLHRGETHVSRAATTASPPRPSALAFAPARARRWRSSSTGVTAPNILVSAASDTSTSQAYLRAPNLTMLFCGAS